MTLRFFAPGLPGKVRHLTSFSAFQAKLDQDEKNNLRRLALEAEAESPRESFDTYLMPQQCDLMVVIEGSDTCIEHPLYVVIIAFGLFGTCHSWLAASPPMASGDVGNLRDSTCLLAVFMFSLLEL